METKTVRTVNMFRRIPPRHFRVAWFATLAIACLCAMAGNTLAQDAARPRAVVYGDIESPLLQPLGRSVTLIPYNGSVEQLENAQLLILDGDHFSPEMLQSDELVGAALRSGL